MTRVCGAALVEEEELMLVRVEMEELDVDELDVELDTELEVGVELEVVDDDVGDDVDDDVEMVVDDEEEGALDVV